ncbi:MAG: hypothetical protein Q9164_004203, partial [Protoblastenia rupestris]
MSAAKDANDHVPHTSNAATDHIIPLLINGEEVTTNTTFEVVSPVTNDTVWSCSSASIDLAIHAAEAAQAAFPAWKKTKPAYRRDIFIKASDIMKRRAAECAEYMEIETGSQPGYSRDFNVPSGIEQLRDVAGRIATFTGSIPISSTEGKNVLLFKEPYGVILGIAPWNAPYILGLRAITYAIATGNTCVLKGSELSPRCFWIIGSILTEAGLPPGVVNILFHRTSDAPSITSTLINHPAIKKINFTGSSATGAIIASQAGAALRPVLMELGGKAPAIILADADLNKAAKAVATGAFLHSGQICMSTERVLVHDSIIAPFTTALQTAISSLYPTSSPPQILINPSSVKKVKSLIHDAVSKGATIIPYPPYPSPEPPSDPSSTTPAPHKDVSTTSSSSSSTHMRPTLLTSLNPNMTLHKTESFGPCLTLHPFTTSTEALEMANDTPYGLSASIFTSDLAK